MADSKVSKLDTLRDSATLNPHPDRVQDTLFLEHDTFFDAADLLQVRYEMLRRVLLEGHSVTETARTFGVSRPTFYEAQAAFEHFGLFGLFPRKRGPHGPHKLTEEILNFIDQQRAPDEPIRAPKLSSRIEERFGTKIHPRSIERVVAPQKKKRR